MNTQHKEDLTELCRMQIERIDTLTLALSEAQVRIGAMAMELAAANLRAEETEGMAECMRMFRDDMIRMGVITEKVAPMFMTEAMSNAMGERLAAQKTEIETAPAPATPAASVDTAQYDAGRQQGRAEALAILMELDPEGGIDAYTGWSAPVGPDDEGSAYWEAEKLREMFAADGALEDMMDKAMAEYWQYIGMQDEAEHAKNFAANMHSSGKVRDVLAKAGEFDLMGRLCAAAPQQHAQAAQPLVSGAMQAMADAGLNVSVSGEKVQPRGVSEHAQAALSDAARNVIAAFNDPHTSLAGVARWINELAEVLAASQQPAADGTVTDYGTPAPSPVQREVKS